MRIRPLKRREVSDGPRKELPRTQLVTERRKGVKLGYVGTFNKPKQPNLLKSLSPPKLRLKRRLRLNVSASKKQIREANFI